MNWIVYRRDCFEWMKPHCFGIGDLDRLLCESKVLHEDCNQEPSTFCLAFKRLRPLAGSHARSVPTAFVKATDALQRNIPVNHQLAPKTVVSASRRAVSLNGLMRHSAALCLSRRGRTASLLCAVMNMMGTSRSR